MGVLYLGNLLTAQFPDAMVIPQPRTCGLVAVTCRQGPSAQHEELSVTRPPIFMFEEHYVRDKRPHHQTRSRPSLR